MVSSPTILSERPSDLVLASEVPVILKIIRDETWLESERRGYPVAANDCVVKENVCRVVLRIGQQMRDAIEIQLAIVERAGRESEKREQRAENRGQEAGMAHGVAG